MRRLLYGALRADDRHRQLSSTVRWVRSFSEALELSRRKCGAMNHSYQTWEKFNVDKELSKIEEEEKREEVQKKAAAVEQKKDALLGEVVDSVQEQTEALTAHAAIAALRAKRNKRNVARVAAPELNQPVEVVEELQKQVDVVQHFAMKMQEMRRHKAEGDANRKEMHYEAAVSHYRTALAAADDVAAFARRFGSHFEQQVRIARLLTLHLLLVK